MSEIILKTDIKRESGMLYFVTTLDNGCLAVGKALMARGRKKKDGKK